MFKGNKEKDNNYITTEEVERMYEFQNKAFESKVAEQEKKIEELTNYVSARFGEDVANSNISTKLKNIEENLQKIQTDYKTNLEKTKKSIKKEIEKESQKIATDLNDAQTESYFKLVQKNENDLEKLKNIFGENRQYEKITNLDKNLQKHIEDTELYKQEIEKEFKVTNQKISKINYLGITTKFDKKIKEECGKLNEQIKEIRSNTEDNITKLDEQFLDKLEQVQISLQANGEEILKLQTMFVTENEKVTSNVENNENRVVVLDERLTDEIEGIDKDLEKIENSVSDLDAKLTKRIETANEILSNKTEKISLKVKENESATIKLDKKVTKEIEKINATIQEKNNENAIKELDEKIQSINNDVQNNEMTIVGLEANCAKQTEQTKEAINKLKDIFKNKNIKLEERIKLTDEKLAVVREETKQDTLIETEKIKEELSKQIINKHKENKAELETITGAVEDIKDETENAMMAIGQEISKLKQEVKASLESQDNTDIELLKKDYNKYVTKMNNELAKISKDLLNAQKKNLEQNRNLQAKIKAYIDAKVEKSSSAEKIEELINNLNLSILEREKLQKIEMEELLNKKLKAIQKENERILNKKIEEISSKLIRENSTRPKPNNVTLYEEAPKKKKNMYELIDENQILKRSAESKNPLSSAKEGKSQILKFFYDDEDNN